MEMALGNTSLLVKSLFFLFFNGFGDKRGLIYFADWYSNTVTIN